MFRCETYTILRETVITRTIPSAVYCVLCLCVTLGVLCAVCCLLCVTLGVLCAVYCVLCLCVTLGVLCAVYCVLCVCHIGCVVDYSTYIL
jgi:hypothetical protein